MWSRVRDVSTRGPSDGGSESSASSTGASVPVASRRFDAKVQRVVSLSMSVSDPDNTTVVEVPSGEDLGGLAVPLLPHAARKPLANRTRPAASAVTIFIEE